jgi:hypothetical protein
VRVGPRPRRRGARRPGAGRFRDHLDRLYLHDRRRRRRRGLRRGGRTSRLPHRAGPRGDVTEVGDPVLEAVEASEKPGARVVDRGQEQPGAQQLELQPGSGRALELGQAGAHQVGRPGELGQAEPLGLRTHDRDLAVGGVEQAGLDGVGHLVQDDEVSQPFEQVGREAPRVQTTVDDPVDDGEHRGAVGVGERVDRLVEQGGVGEAELGDGVGVRQALGAGAGDELPEDRQGVAHRAGRRPSDQGERLRLRRHTLLLRDPPEVLLQPAYAHQAIGVVVRARADGREDLVGLGRREHEHQVRRRLLDQLEEGVGRVDRELVRLVDDVDLVAARGGGVHRLLAQLAGIVDAAVARGVHLDDVEGTGAVGREVLAAGALAAGLGGGSLLAVERAGQDPGRRGLAAPARAGEQVGVVRPPGVDGAAERNRDVLLPDDVGETSRAVGAVQGQRHPSTLAAPSHPHSSTHARAPQLAVARGGSRWRCPR